MGRLEELAKMVAEHAVAPPDDEVLEKDYPLLWEMLTSARYSDGRERILPTIRIERISGGYRAVLADDSLWVRKSAVALTWAEIPAALEKALADASVPWEHFKSYKNAKGPQVGEEKSPRKKRR